MSDPEDVRERTALTELPYEYDPELSWRAPVGPDLPYDGRIREEVLELAKTRRRGQSGT
ncbi:MAG: hypothetical protein ACR2MA_01740 [Egibacteraceae bacterium]